MKWRYSKEISKNLTNLQHHHKCIVFNNETLTDQAQSENSPFRNYRKVQEARP